GLAVIVARRSGKVEPEKRKGRDLDHFIDRPIPWSRADDCAVRLDHQTIAGLRQVDHLAVFHSEAALTLIEDNEQVAVLQKKIEDRAAHADCRDRSLERVALRVLGSGDKAKCASAGLKHHVPMSALGIVDEAIQLDLRFWSDAKARLIEEQK